MQAGQLLAELLLADLGHVVAAAPRASDVAIAELHFVGDLPAFRDLGQEREVAAARVLVNAVLEFDDPLARLGQDVHVQVGFAAIEFVGEEHAAAKPGRKHFGGGQSRNAGDRNHQQRRQRRSPAPAGGR